MNLNLNHEGFESHLVTRENACGGVRYRFKFDNGYGASVIKNWGSYGSRKDQWELAVTKYDGDDWGLCYDTEITDDVLGYLTDDEVRVYLKRIKEL
jgi:hypothetical protein